MANIGEIYSEVTRGIEQSALSKDNGVDKLALQIDHTSWLKSSMTQRFLEALKAEKAAVYAALKDKSSSSLASSDEIRWDGIKLKQLDTIIEYAEKHLPESSSIN